MIVGAHATTLDGLEVLFDFDTRYSSESIEERSKKKKKET